MYSSSNYSWLTSSSCSWLDSLQGSDWQDDPCPDAFGSNLESPILLTCMWEEAVLEGTTQTWGKHANSTQDHRTFLANHCTTAPTMKPHSHHNYQCIHLYTVSQLQQVFIHLWQNALASQVITFDKFQRHQLLFFSMKTNYRLFDLWPLSLLMSPLMSLLPPFTLAPLF